MRIQGWTKIACAAATVLMLVGTAIGSDQDSWTAAPEPEAWSSAETKVYADDQVTLASMLENSGACGSCSSCADAACGPIACGCGGGGDKPFQLFGRGRLAQDYGIKIGGWLQQGITGAADRPTDGFHGPVALNDSNGEYQMNQFWLYLMRPTNTGGHGFDIGGRLDLIYGTDYRFGINNGLEDRINAIDQAYGLVIPQAYAEVAYNDLTVRAGHYASLLSYEQVPSVLNFFYSHSYTMGYADPQLVTGVNVNYKLSDTLSLDGGFHRGWMQFEDNNDELDFMGGATWTSGSKNTTLKLYLTAGPQDAAGAQDQYVCSFQWLQTISKKMRYALVNHVGNTTDGDLFSRDDAEFYSLVNYLYYDINPCWSAGLRYEWFHDDDGSRVAGIGSLGRRGWDSPPGFAGDFQAMTLGLNWRPHPNIVVRPELRYDWYDGTNNMITQQRPFAGGGQSDQLTFGTDVIVTF